MAEDVLEKLGRQDHWTAGVPLSGGDFPWDGADDLIANLRGTYPFLDKAWATRLVRTYGTRAKVLLGAAQNATDLGADFGATLTEAELDYLCTHEFARSAEDVLWRRTKLGLYLDAAQTEKIEHWMQQRGKKTT